MVFKPYREWRIRMVALGANADFNLALFFQNVNFNTLFVAAELQVYVPVVNREVFDTQIVQKRRKVWIIELNQAFGSANLQAQRGRKQ